MPVIYFESSFGGVPFLAASLDTERGRDIAVQSPSLGDRHTLRDRGLKQQRTTCEILFIDQPGLAPYTDRCDEFVALAEKPEPQIFSHALHGSFRARAGELTVRADGGAREIRVSCQILRDEPPETVLPVAGGTNPAAGVESVTAAAATASEALLELGDAAAPDLAADAREDGIRYAELAGIADTVAAWNDAGDELDSQQVFLEVASAVDRIDALTEDLELLSDITRWQAYRDVVRLRYEVVRAGEAFTAAARSTFDVYVEQPRPVLAICAEIYGAAQARERAEEVAANNRLRTPGRVPAGTTLKMPAVSR
ncbi:MAG TPA: DNA circularization N-terminal domain-containing protein [Kofleriaceae bacterium]|nr:DNA circularization N-terminal domain-containing protein [Kofleriaceae bacterium]